MIFAGTESQDQVNISPKINISSRPLKMARWGSCGREERPGCSSGGKVEEGEQDLPAGSARQLESPTIGLCKAELNLN